MNLGGLMNNKFIRFLSIAAVVVLVLSALLALGFAIAFMVTKNPFFNNAWRASAFCMLLIPFLLFAMIKIAQVLKGRGVK